MDVEQEEAQTLDNNFFDFLRNNSLLTDDSNDPDMFLNENFDTETLNTPVYEYPGPPSILMNVKI